MGFANLPEYWRRLRSITTAHPAPCEYPARARRTAVVIGGIRTIFAAAAARWPRNTYISAEIRADGVGDIARGKVRVTFLSCAYPRGHAVRQ